MGGKEDASIPTASVLERGAMLGLFSSKGSGWRGSLALYKVPSDLLLLESTCRSVGLSTDLVVLICLVSNDSHFINNSLGSTERRLKMRCELTIAWCLEESQPF